MPKLLLLKLLTNPKTSSKIEREREHRIKNEKGTLIEIL